MNRITLLYPYYENPQMLAHQVSVWSGYHDAIKEHLEIILVDDASPENPALPIIRNLDAHHRLYRIKQDIRWNHPGARNLGFREAVPGWVLATDMDHVVPAPEMQKLIERRWDPSCFYRPARLKMPQLEPVSPHQNSFLIQRDTFLEVGGYDEDYCGYYGGEDGALMAVLDTVSSLMLLDDVYLHLFDNDVIADANTTAFTRKEGPGYSLNNSYLRAKRSMRPYRAINPIRFDWERVV